MANLRKTAVIDYKTVVLIGNLTRKEYAEPINAKQARNLCRMWHKDKLEVTVLLEGKPKTYIFN
jgi:hypothetical protein